MLQEELVYLIADSIFRDLCDNKTIIAVRDFSKLSENERQTFLNMAHNIMCIYDNYWDAEFDDDDDLDDDVYEEPDDDYKDHTTWWEL